MRRGARIAVQPATSLRRRPLPVQHRPVHAPLREHLRPVRAQHQARRTPALVFEGLLQRERSGAGRLRMPPLSCALCRGPLRARLRLPSAHPIQHRSHLRRRGESDAHSHESHGGKTTRCCCAAPSRVPSPKQPAAPRPTIRSPCRSSMAAGSSCCCRCV